MARNLRRRAVDAFAGLAVRHAGTSSHRSRVAARASQRTPARSAPAASNRFEPERLLLSSHFCPICGTRHGMGGAS